MKAVVYFEKDHQLLRGSTPDFSDESGNLVFRQDFACSEKGEADPLMLHLPMALVQPGERNVDATVQLFSKSGEFLDEFKPVTVNFPKSYTPRQSASTTRDDKNGWSTMTITPLKAESVESEKKSTASDQTGTLISSSQAQGSPARSILTISSEPLGAEIFLDDNFVGNTPSTINASLGKHAVTVRKLGFQEWVRAVNVYSGSITLNAELVHANSETHTANPPSGNSITNSATARVASNSSGKSIGWIGIHLQNSGDGAIVTNVNADSPGEKAGIQIGDVILALDGRLIKGRDFETAVAGLKPGTQISINYARGSSAHEVSMTVGSHNISLLQ